MQQKNDKKSQTYEQKVRLFSIVSQKHVQILKRHVNAKAEEDNQHSKYILYMAVYELNLQCTWTASG